MMRQENNKATYTTRYKHLVIENPDSPPTSIELAAIEDKLGTLLPEEFVEFLEVANGGILNYLVRIPPGVWFEFSCLNSTKRQTNNPKGFNTFLGEIAIERKYRKVPDAYLPFARGETASVLYLDLTTQGAGRILAFVQGHPLLVAVGINESFVEVAGSFAEFVQLLHKNAPPSSRVTSAGD